MKYVKPVSFIVACLLIVGPWIGYIICWMLNVSDVDFDEWLVATHVAGILAMLVWSILYLKANPRLARTGLILAALFLAFWAFALFS
jgi:hypothetical protein